MTLHIIDCEQGSDEWRSARCGIPTASRFSEILAKGEGRTRAKYLRELAAERMRGYPEPDSYSNSHMDRGHELETEARALYSMTFANSPVRRVGFIHNGRAGCSPDSLVGDDGGLEIKSALGHIQVERIARGTVPPEHVAQVQGNIWLAEREWWDFMSYCPDMQPFVIRAVRDDAYIAKLSEAVDAFNDELDALVSSIRGVDQFRRAVA
jgi:hypothetical protein